MIQPKHIARTALLAFLLNALLPFFAAYDVSAQQLAAKQAVFGEKILICTGDGFKWVRWQDLQKQKPHEAPTHLKCPLCYLAAHGTAITPDAVALAAPIQQAAVRYFYHYHSLSLSLASAHGSRAPPALPSFS